MSSGRGRRWSAAFRRRVPSIGLLIPTIAALTACTFQSPSDDLSIRTPGTWVAASSGTERKISTGWLDEFTDRGLKRSVNQALAHNRSLKAASARLREAEQTTIITRANQLPALGVGGSGRVPTAHRSRNPKLRPQPRRLLGAGSLGPPPRSHPRRRSRRTRCHRGFPGRTPLPRRQRRQGLHQPRVRRAGSGSREVHPRVLSEKPPHHRAQLQGHRRGCARYPVRPHQRIVRPALARSTFTRPRKRRPHS